MASGRYTYRRVLLNQMRAYEQHFKRRNVKLINHYNTPNMSYPNASQMENITSLVHVWKHGDRYYKLAHKHYGDKTLWWLIAWFNKAPTESHLSTGQTIKIPFPLEAALTYMRDKY